MSKRPVLELCDFMVCGRKYCDVPNFKFTEKCKERRVKQQCFHYSKKHSKYREENSEEETTSEEEESEEEITCETENRSSFELIRQKNIEDKMAFLKSLRMNEIVDELEENAKRERKRKLLARKLKRTTEKVQVTRRSKRMEHFTMNYAEQDLQAKASEMVPVSSKKHKVSSLLCSFEDAFHGNKIYISQDYEKYFLDLEIKEETLQTSFSHDLGVFDPSVFTSTDLFYYDLTTIAFHPAVNKTILFAGLQCGKILLWNKDTEPYMFSPHLGIKPPVTHIKVNPECPSQIFSSSEDGTLQKIDIEKKCFEEVFKGDEAIKYFDFVSPNEFLLAVSDGCVSLVDYREAGYKSGYVLRCRPKWNSISKKLMTISAHPTKKDICLTLDYDRTMKVWDLRFNQKPIACEAVNDEAGSASALFSPITGNSILYSSKQTIRMFDSSRLEEVFQFRWKVKSHQYTSATWLPRSESAFLVSNNEIKRTLILQSELGQLESGLDHRERKRIILQAVHPVRNVLAVTIKSRNKTRIKLFLS